MWWGVPVPGTGGARPLQILRNGLPHTLQDRHRWVTSEQHFDKVKAILHLNLLHTSVMMILKACGPCHLSCWKWMLFKSDLRCSGDNWNGIMKDTLREECDASDDCLRNCCVNQYVAPLFFVVFVLMAQFVLVNVVVAVLMKHLEESHKQVKLYRQTVASVEKDDETDLLYLYPAG